MYNVLLITADQWRGDCLSAVGHPCVRTPNLDRLAAEGVLFERHFGQATPCGPSRASLYTGLYLFNHRSVSNGTPLDARHRTVAEYARRSGYDPVLFGYTDISHDPRRLPPDDPRLRTFEGTAPGFREVLFLPEDMGPWLDHLAERGYGRRSIEEIYDIPLGAPAPFRAEDSETAFLTDRFLAWLEGSARTPWFAHLSYIKPHPPFVVADPWRSRISPERTPPAVRRAECAEEAALHPWLAVHLALGYGGWIGRHVGSPDGLDARKVAQVRALYYGLVEEVDHHLGRIFRRLGELDMLDRTLIVFTSDHGEMLGDHWMLGKAGFFPQAFHVPMILRDPRPGAARGSRIGLFTEHVDVMPTILEFLGIEVPLQCDGRSLLPLLAGRMPGDWRQAAIYEHDFRDLEEGTYEQRLGLAPDACALIVRLSETDAYVHFLELPALHFDLREDPEWFRDRAGKAECCGEVLAACQKLLSFRMLKNERRLTGALLSPSGVRGRFDPH